MEIFTGLLSLIVVLMVAAYIVQPFFSNRRGDGRSRAGHRPASVLRRRADLLARRNEIYRAIRELDFDYQTNKVSDEDYDGQRHALVAQGVEVLQQLDALPVLDESPDADPIEAAVAALRVGAAAPGAAVEAGQAGFCGQCGAPVYAGDRFCGACGAALTSTSKSG
jgi:hypothetical protein